MNIKIEKSGSYYVADCKDIPGSPPIGIGKSKKVAIANLFLEIQKNKLWDYIDVQTLNIC